MRAEQPFIEKLLDPGFVPTGNAVEMVLPARERLYPVFVRSHDFAQRDRETSAVVARTDEFKAIREQHQCAVAAAAAFVVCPVLKSLCWPWDRIRRPGRDGPETIIAL